MISQCVDRKGIAMKVLEEAIVGKTILYMLHHPFGTMVVQTYGARDNFFVFLFVYLLFYIPWKYCKQKKRIN